MLMIVNYRRKWRALVVLGALLTTFFAWPGSFAMPALSTSVTIKMNEIPKNYKFLHYNNASEAHHHTEVLGSTRSEEQYYNSQRIKENNFIYNKRKRKKLLDILRTRNSKWRNQRRWLLRVVEPQVNNSDMLSEMFTSISENDDKSHHHQLLLHRSKRAEGSINSTNSRTKIRRLKVNNRNISKLERNERSPRELKQKRLLFGGHYMQILPTGMVSGTTDANDYSKYCF